MPPAIGTSSTNATAVARFNIEFPPGRAPRAYWATHYTRSVDSMRNLIAITRHAGEVVDRGGGSGSGAPRAEASRLPSNPGSAHGEPGDAFWLLDPDLYRSHPCSWRAVTAPVDELSTASRWPSATISTRPSGRLRAQPEMPSAPACSAQLPRYQTPWTLPLTQRCRRTISQKLAAVGMPTPTAHQRPRAAEKPRPQSA